jgi:hypothetical protein
MLDSLLGQWFTGNPVSPDALDEWLHCSLNLDRIDRIDRMKKEERTMAR